MRVIGDKNQISEDVFDFMISYLLFPQKSIRSELAKLRSELARLFAISIYAKRSNENFFFILEGISRYVSNIIKARHAYIHTETFKYRFSIFYIT